MSLTLTTRPSPSTILALVLVIGGGVTWLRGSDDSATNAECDPTTTSCRATLQSASVPAPTARASSEFCINVGYLCAGLATEPEVRLRRWRDFEGTMVVHVPLPEYVGSSGDPRALQRAAAQGIRAWNNQPFAILTDLRGDREPHFTVRWTPSLGGAQIGVARTQWSPANGLSVLSIELVTQSPFGSGPADPRRVRLTAAHEMGHALGLPHSDSSRDVMYPTNTALTMSAQDYRSIEVLYETPDGTAIRR